MKNQVKEQNKKQKPASIIIHPPLGPDRNKISVIPEEENKGVKRQLEKDYGHRIREYRLIGLPLSCEYCIGVGEPTWHCANPKSKKYGLNVNPYEVCSKWEPNLGLMMYLNHRYIHAEISRYRRHDRNVLRDKKK